MNKVLEINKAWIGGIVAALLPWLLVDLLGVEVPQNVMLALNGIVVAVVVWAVPNVQRAIDKATK